MSGRCLEGLWRVSGWCLESVSKYCISQSVSKYLKVFQSVPKCLKVLKVSQTVLKVFSKYLKVVKLRPCSASRNLFFLRPRDYICFFLSLRNVQILLYLGCVGYYVGTLYIAYQIVLEILLVKLMIIS